MSLLFLRALLILCDGFRGVSHHLQFEYMFVAQLILTTTSSEATATTATTATNAATTIVATTVATIKYDHSSPVTDAGR